MSRAAHSVGLLAVEPPNSARLSGEMSGVYQQHQIGSKPPERPREVFGGRAGIKDETIGSGLDARCKVTRDPHADCVVPVQVVADPQYRDAGGSVTDAEELVKSLVECQHEWAIRR